MHNLMLLSFFLTKRTGAPQGETLNLMNHYTNNSYYYILSSFRSSGVIGYDALEVGAVPATKSIPNSTSLASHSLGTSSRNTSAKSLTTGICSISRANYLGIATILLRKTSYLRSVNLWVPLTQYQTSPSISASTLNAIQFHFSLYWTFSFM